MWFVRPGCALYAPGRALPWSHVGGSVQLTVWSHRGECLRPARTRALPSHHCPHKPSPNRAATYFMDTIFPQLTPLSVDPAHPFPFLANRGYGLAMQVRAEAEAEADVEAARRRPAGEAPPAVTGDGSRRFERVCGQWRVSSTHDVCIFTSPLTPPPPPRVRSCCARRTAAASRACSCSPQRSNALSACPARQRRQRRCRPSTRRTPSCRSTPRRARRRRPPPRQEQLRIVVESSGAATRRRGSGDAAVRQDPSTLHVIWSNVTRARPSPPPRPRPRSSRHAPVIC